MLSDTFGSEGWAFLSQGPRELMERYKTEVAGNDEFSQGDAKQQQGVDASSSTY